MSHMAGWPCRHVPANELDLHGEMHPSTFELLGNRVPARFVLPFWGQLGYVLHRTCGVPGSPLAVTMGEVCC